jgi:predicted nucleotidyltransferase
MGRNDRMKIEIARDAARLLFEEEVRGYREARRQAVRRFGPSVSASRGAHLPEYVEIHSELRQLMRFHGGEQLAQRVRQWRLLALKYLEWLEPFQPLLVGSVQRGEVREISDINLQLFCDKPEEVGYFFEREGISFTEEGDAEATRYYLEDEEIEVECAVFPLNVRRQRSQCRITGAPLERVGCKQLRELLDGGEV